MKNSLVYYSVGALLYCPANHKTIASSITGERFGTKYSLALCLEDTIQDDCVKDAEQKMLDSLHTVHRAFHDNQTGTGFFLPNIFVRVRCPEQISSLHRRAGDVKELITGYILPKFAPDNADAYLEAIREVNRVSSKTVYMMPILESPAIIHLQHRSSILYGLKEKLDSVEPYVLNIRVGGNDLCHMFGFRRHDNESIHSIRPVADIFSDIITVFGMDYVVSGPVWEYYGSAGWDTGLSKELSEDRLCGFTGKTVIHPKQIAPVNSAYQVPRADMEDAKAILNWNTDKASGTLVAGSSQGERMNEYKTHFHWAQKVLFLAEYYGVKD